MPQYAGLPIVALTASADPDSVQECIDAGFNEVLTKPIDLGLLIQILDKHLGGPETRECSES